MLRRLAPAAVTSLIAACALPGAASAEGRSVYQSKLLWATINVCDTAEHPDTVGIRASMPGSGVKGERMYMRFQLQYYTVSDNRWHNVGASGDSGFIPVGSAMFRVRQAGRNFSVRPPATGAFILRGAVTFEWRKDGEVVRRARKRTRSGHPNTKGADPRSYSVAKCEVRS